MFNKYVLRPQLKIISLLTLLGICLTIIIGTHSDSSAAKDQSGGVTIFFRHGGTMHLPSCSIRDFPKAIGDPSTSRRDNRMQTYCGGGSETLERIDMSEVVGICAGQCSS